MNRLKAAILGTLFVLLWSSGWTVSQFAVVNSSALNILGVRYLLLVAALVIIVTALRQWQRIPTRYVVIHLMIGTLCHGLYLIGSISSFELGVSAAVVAFINALQPMTAASLGGFANAEKLHKQQYTGLFLGVLSVALVVLESYRHEGISIFALAIPFIAVLALSAGMVLNRHQEMHAKASNQPSLPVMLILLIHAIGAVAIIVPLALIQGKLQWHFPVTQWVAIVWLVLAVSLGSYGILLVLLRHMSALRASSFTYLVPPTTMLQSYLMFGDPISLTDIVSLCLAGTAVYMILTRSPATANSPQQTPRKAPRLAQQRSKQILQLPSNTALALQLILRRSYVAELAFFAFLVSSGVSLNSVAVIALGILLLVHCLPSLMLATMNLRNSSDELDKNLRNANDVYTVREKEVIALTSNALLIGVSIGLLFLILQKFSHMPISDSGKLLMLGLVCMAIATMLQAIAHIIYGKAAFSKISGMQLASILVVFMVFIIALIENQKIQSSIDLVVGLGALTYVLYASGLSLLLTAKNYTSEAPVGLTMDFFRQHILSMPGVKDVNKASLRRINDHDYALDVQLSLAGYLQKNSKILMRTLKEQIQHDLGISKVFIELNWKNGNPSHKNTDTHTISPRNSPSSASRQRWINVTAPGSPQTRALRAVAKNDPSHSAV